MQIYLTSKISCMVLRSEFSFSKDNEINEQSTHKYNKNIIENFEVKKQENIQTNLECSDSEYDMLFEKMQVISNTEDKKLIEKKQKKINKKDLSNNPIVSMCICLFFFYLLKTRINENKLFFFLFFNI